MKNLVVFLALGILGCSGPVSRTISGTLTIPHPAQTKAVFSGTGGHVAFPVDAQGNFTAVLRAPGAYTLRFVGTNGAPGVLGTLTNSGGIQRIRVGVKNSSLAMGNIAYQDGSTGTPPASNADHSCSGNGDDLRAEHEDDEAGEADDDGPEWDGLDDGEGIEAPEADDDDDGDDVCEAEEDEDEDEGDDD